MAHYEAATGAWVANNGTYWGSEAEAEASDQDNPDADPTDSFGAGGTDPTASSPNVGAAHDPNDDPNPANPGGISNNDLWSQQHNAAVNQQASDATAIANAPFNREYGDQNQYQIDPNTGTYYTGNERPKQPGSFGGDLLALGGAAGSVAINPVGSLVNLATGTNYGDYIDPIAGGQSVIARGLSNTANDSSSNTQGTDGGSNTLPGTTRTGGTGAPAPAPDPADAANAANLPSTAGDPEAQSEWAAAYDGYKGLRENTTDSDQSRAVQQEGMQLQRDLLAKLYAFDPKQYASQFSDAALARQIAIARSGTNAAGQNAGYFAAMDQAPALYAQGQQQADALENQRLSQAENAVTNFGQLGTATRSQDVSQEQFQATLAKSIQDSLVSVTENKVKLSDEEAQTFASLWLGFAQLEQQKVFGDDATALKWFEDQLTAQGLGQQKDEFEESLKAQGKITPKDILGGFMALGGSVIGAGGSILSAKAKSA